MELGLHLYEQPQRGLVGEWKYLHQRTAGFIGTLSQLVREAAILAIESGQERIDRALLDEVTVDEASTQSYERTQATAAAAMRQQARRVG